jgi:hypothetical protein
MPWAVVKVVLGRGDFAHRRDTDGEFVSSVQAQDGVDLGLIVYVVHVPVVRWPGATRSTKGARGLSGYGFCGGGAGTPLRWSVW